MDREHLMSLNNPSRGGRVHRCTCCPCSPLAEVDRLRDELARRSQELERVQSDTSKRDELLIENTRLGQENRALRGAPV